MARVSTYTDVALTAGHCLTLLHNPSQKPQYYPVIPTGTQQTSGPKLLFLIRFCFRRLVPFTGQEFNTGVFLSDVITCMILIAFSRSFIYLIEHL